MTTPEVPKTPTPEQDSTPSTVLYPFSLEFHQEISDLTAKALEKAELSDHTSGQEAYKSYIWRSHTLAGIICRIESPLVLDGDNTVYTLWYELHGTGRLPGSSSIEKGLRHPEPGNPRPYGLVAYTENGVVRENEQKSTLVKRFVEIIAKKDWDNPVQRGEGYELLLKTILSAAPRGWEKPIPLPDYSRHLR